VVAPVSAGHRAGRQELDVAERGLPHLGGVGEVVQLVEQVG
jgi:hypothetical protein